MGPWWVFFLLFFFIGVLYSPDVAMILDLIRLSSALTELIVGGDLETDLSKVESK